MTSLFLFFRLICCPFYPYFSILFSLCSPFHFLFCVRCVRLIRK
jgi:hypothetical protein